MLRAATEELIERLNVRKGSRGIARGDSVFTSGRVREAPRASRQHGWNPAVVARAWSPRRRDRSRNRGSRDRHRKIMMSWSTSKSAVPNGSSPTRKSWRGSPWTEPSKASKSLGWRVRRPNGGDFEVRSMKMCAARVSIRE
jgi:hypothetical protein